MEAGKYLFVPLAYPGKEDTGRRAQDWLEGQPVSNDSIRESLKLYSRKVGIAEEKLTLMALRRTAIRFRMDAGESMEGMKLFMDSKDPIKSTKYRLGWLPEVEEVNTMGEKKRKMEVDVPVRSAKPFKLGENVTHGFYARRVDKQAVRAELHPIRWTDS